MFESTSEPALGWPSYRLQFGIGGVLFSLFEALVARQLPGLLVLVVFGMAVGALMSGISAAQEWRQQVMMGMIGQAMAEARVTQQRRS